MTGYQPNSASAVAGVAVAVGLMVLASRILARGRDRGASRVLAWSIGPMAVAAVHLIAVDEPAGVRMLALVAIVWCWMKTVVLVEAKAHGVAPLPFGRWLTFTLLWPGMRPQLLAKRVQGALPGAGALALRGTLCVVIGISLLLAAHWLWRETKSAPAATPAILVGLSLILHFGLFAWWVAGARCFGFDVRELFQSPHRSRSLGEFWSRRWNIPFSEMIQGSIYRPLAKAKGREVATIAGFLFSGVLHEIGISLPVQAGFGLPFLYFALHGALILLERSLTRRGRGGFLNGGPGRLWTAFWLIAPLPILFHRPCLEGIVWPILGIH